MKEISRRTFLARSLAVLGASSLASCSRTNEFSCEVELGFDCNLPIGAENLESGKSFVYSLVSPLNSLLPLDRQDLQIYFHQFDGAKSLDGSTGFPQNQIHVFLPFGVAVPLGVVALVGFHEMVHNFDNLNKNGRFAASSSLANFYSKAISSEKSSEIFRIFDESSYFNLKNFELGHPKSTFVELFASAVTVLRFAPKGFMRRVDNRSDINRKSCVEIASKSLLSIKNLSSRDVRLSELAFGKQLLKFLEIEDEKASF